MIEISPSGLALLLAIILLCMVAGWFWSRNLPWSQEAHRVHMPALAGLALGPFLFAMSGVVVLGLLPGASHQTHLLASLCLIAGALLAGWLFGRGRVQRFVPPSEARLTIGELALVAALAFAAAALLFISVFVPLTQNDSLEYATVGRILFEARTLAAYPVLNPETNSAGFFGPWTHPPLYVAAIYLVEIIQGHAQAPGALRLISPWFLLTATGVVYATGALVDRRTGLASALIFVTTPLLFLGAGSALLDALYVSAFALLVAALSSIEARPVARGAIIGATIGLGLWTHSVAVLFLPLGLAGLAIHRGVLNVRKLAREMTAAVVFAFLVGGWWYWRNIVLFGSPISDNPAVFALPSLHWNDYFIVNRGLDTPVAMIQYGLLKGWFAVEAFAATYWGMTVGLIILIARGGRKPAFEALLHGAKVLPHGVIYLVFGVLCTYLCGVIVSISLHLDIMVKNERYLLSIQALVAVGAGYGFTALLELISAQTKRYRNHVYLLGSAILTSALVIQCSVFVRYTMDKFDLRIESIGGVSFSEVLNRLPEYQLIDYLRTRTQKDAKVLSLRPADLYYAYRPMVSYLDERLVPFYGISSAEEGAEYLKRLDIEYVHVPDYGLPPLYNSVLYKILRSRSLSKLLVSTTGGQIYKLTPAERLNSTVHHLPPGQSQWVKEDFFFLGGKKRLSSIVTQRARPLEGTTSTTTLPLGAFQRNVITFLRSGRPDKDALPELLEIPPGSEIAVDIKIEGLGLVGLLVNEYALESPVTPNSWLRITRLGTFELTAAQPVRSFARRMKVFPGTRWLSIVLEHQGQSTLTLRDVHVTVFR